MYAKSPELYKNKRPSKPYKDLTDDQKDKARAACRAYYQLNKESYLIRKQDWISKNPEKHKLHKLNYAHNKRAAGSLSTNILHTWASQQPKQCFYCAKDLSILPYHLDHYVPISKGGLHTLDNLVIACPSCNCSKHNKLPEEYLKQVARDLGIEYLLSKS